MPDKKIIAVDFDGMLTTGDKRIWTGKNHYINDVMVARQEIISWIIQNRDKFYFVLWTSRTGTALSDAVWWCYEHGVVFDAVNRNIVKFKTSHKIYADYYLDDKSITEDDLCQL